MKRNAIIFHGTGGTPKHFWFPYVKKELEKMGYDVSIPQLPYSNKPDIDKWLPYAMENETFKENTVTIGHSAGCPLILSTLENIDTKIAKAILVAGFVEPMDDNPEPILQENYDWKKIRSNVKDIVFINSDNDPWGCDDKQGRKMFDKLVGTLIIRHGERHMGSDKFDQQYKKFPLVVKLIETELDNG